jgi:hypothetical protein
MVALGTSTGTSIQHFATGAMASRVNPKENVSVSFPVTVAIVISIVCSKDYRVRDGKT